MGSFLLVPVWETFQNSSLLCFLLSHTQEMDRIRGECPGLPQHALRKIPLVIEAMREIPWFQVHYGHATATINPSLVLNNKLLAKFPILSIWWMTAMTLWSAALACGNGRSRIPAICQRTRCERSNVLVQHGFLAKFLQRKSHGRQSFSRSCALT